MFIGGLLIGCEYFRKILRIKQNKIICFVKCLFQFIDGLLLTPEPDETPNFIHMNRQKLVPTVECSCKNRENRDHEPPAKLLDYWVFRQCSPA